VEGLKTGTSSGRGLERVAICQVILCQDFVRGRPSCVVIFVMTVDTWPDRLRQTPGGAMPAPTCNCNVPSRFHLEGSESAHEHEGATKIVVQGNVCSKLGLGIRVQAM
jgi:hypothetical protein